MSLLLLASCAKEASIPITLTESPPKDDPTSVSNIVLPNGGACLEVGAQASGTGDGVQVWKCDTSRKQAFRFIPSADGSYAVQAPDGRCLDSAVEKPDSPISSNPCADAASQRWFPTAEPGGWYSLRTKDRKLCADVYGGRVANGTPVTGFACHGLDNQRFMIVGLKVPDPTATTPNEPSPTDHRYTLVSLSSGSCIGVTSASSGTGAPAEQSHCDSGPAQRFIFVPEGAESFAIRVQDSGMCLAEGPGSKVLQLACSGATAQHWRLVAHGEGVGSVSTADGKRCLDVFAGKVADGTPVSTYECHFRDNQRFKLEETETGSAGTSLAGSSGTVAGEVRL
jgi:hypothetical protein